MSTSKKSKFDYTCFKPNETVKQINSGQHHRNFVDPQIMFLTEGRKQMNVFVLSRYLL